MPTMSQFYFYCIKHGHKDTLGFLMSVPYLYITFSIAYGICKITGHLDQVKTEGWDE